MSEKIAWMRDASSFKTRMTYRELTYKLATRLLEDGEDDSTLEGVLRAAAEEQPTADGSIIDTAIESMGLAGYELSKVETYLLPTTLNTVTRGVATKGDEEIRFYVERP